MVDMNTSVFPESDDFSQEQITCFVVSLVSFTILLSLFLLLCVALKEKLKSLLEFDINRLQAKPDSNLHAVKISTEPNAITFGNEKLEAPECKSTSNCIWKCTVVIATTILILIYMFDFFQDLYMIYYWVGRKEKIAALIYLALTIIPTILSYFLVLYPLLYHVDSSNKRRRLVLVLLACFPFLKSCILFWTILIGWKRWRARWYLQALTFLWLIEASLEGIPQTILLWFIKYENKDLNIDFYNTQDISLVTNFVSSLLSVFFATKYLNKDEDRRLEHSQRTIGKSYKNKCRM
ncbi:uncharacterized protein LOC133193130 [Saccostrea echinata]|uniref:uncharacterized protein LOC133193130 n=1 Tax=Saccostrea echinata TaxID=191078 RepID=UPI002A8171AA|nr:uncharacterized protein LOC133193130 [Saccostrea echinata]